MRRSGFAWPAGWLFSVVTAAVFLIASPVNAGDAATGLPASGDSPAVEKPAQDAASADKPVPAAEASKKEADAVRIIQAQGGGSGEEPALRKKASTERSARRAAARREKARAGEEEREAEEASRGHYYGPWGYYYGPWGWYPWGGVPQTYYPRPPPPPITHTPRLGLQYNYPYAYQMGIRIPEDSSPLESPPNMGPFVGAVQAAREELARQEMEARGDTSSAIALMEAGKYAEAGRILADGFRDSDDPRYPLLLTEVFFALGKTDHAEALLRHALKLPEAGKALPEEITGHFPSADEFQKKLDAVVAKGDHPLLAAYLLVHSTDPAEGVDLLQKMSRQSPDDEAILRLYRHYLGKALPEKK